MNFANCVLSYLRCLSNIELSLDYMYRTAFLDTAVQENIQ